MLSLIIHSILHFPKFKSPLLYGLYSSIKIFLGCLDLFLTLFYPHFCVIILCSKGQMGMSFTCLIRLQYSKKWVYSNSLIEYLIIFALLLMEFIYLVLSMDSIYIIQLELARQMEDHMRNQSFFSTKSLDDAYLQNLNQSISVSSAIQRVTQNQSPESLPSKFHKDQNIYYFNMFFSPKEVADSLKRRNDNLEMLNFEKSDEEPDDIFNRRKKKVADLMTKEGEQLQVMMQMKDQNQGKFLAIIDFIKFFCSLKEKLASIRTDYYSTKTFCALKNATETELVQLTRAVQKMYNNIMKESKPFEGQSQTASSSSNTIDQRIYQFLIIPRFLISRQKINRLSKDETLQKNFEFLVFHKCLGHYNNEANKKLPEESQMVYVRHLLSRKQGREKFKKICSINHGNKFSKTNGNAYYQLYEKSLEYLRQLENYMKRGKKYEIIKKELEKIPAYTDEGYGSSTNNENESSNNSIYNFKGMDQCLIGIQNKEQVQSGRMSSEMRDEPAEIKFTQVVEMKKRPLKLMSMPLVQEYQEDHKMTKFGVRKSQTMQPKTTENIILVPPPSSFQY